MKIGRNQRCPSGSGKKYKKCCGNRSQTLAIYRPLTSDQTLRTQKAREQIRIEQQGLGKPIISAEWQGNENET